MKIEYKGFTGIYNESNGKYEILKNKEVVFFGSTQKPQKTVLQSMVELYDVFDKIK